MIQLINVHKIYKGNGVQTLALKGISLEIAESEFVAIMGRSGCGKTTLLNIIGCMDDFDSGEYMFKDINIKELNSKQLALIRNKRIGFVFQAFNLINEMTVFENVEVPLGYAGMPRKQRKEIVLEMLEKVGLIDKVKNYPSQLSGGQQQRVAIARALSNNPEIILADEPTGNLDSKNGTEIIELLQSLNNKGTTLVIVTHDEKVASYAKRKIILNDGIIVKDTGAY
ncbi:macrolide ABC transporter ATP-binding protein [Clostridium thermosuccinogenes]|jgi:putative ABC transport system ATP-binding protein|uniref:Macrolide ABC transporter ATP-binding protein n=1 Tax=Clostridium thermosuccinogenes TaxID=84032 RepID=A0A2K2EZL5_9CLOT|nr:ABC transporter ATP-binding protein [Pseudoclostridium thermosuccinogenes]AUS97514.1 macrolide ABC transporter ATP-binding protein [Pseudoclostridium thermosuccinogenes]PNT91772.1 macrolide ABC transporter ATP-binding protein [Pseudoclostridium thermosuccinogenes]PNT91957.1 macrolide ABC transporter ATP-binding protein [Pseudoclostridium thermosuccinogenes]PNT93767.1 macrolide ABC transporter ATP-binding protein [Pseudoclostridium thermosuccinogenes]